MKRSTDSSDVKVYIHYDFVENAYGGGNQFLKALRSFLIQSDAYTDDPRQCHAIIFNMDPGSMANKLHCLRKIMDHTTAPIIARVAGPIHLARNNPAQIVWDKIGAELCRLLAAGLVFQSDWSRRENKKLGYPDRLPCKIIQNAPDSSLFNKEGKSSFNSDRKTRIIATSWSPNLNKGFDVYAWLDQYLDFDAYEMTFVGNSPIEFRNIRRMPPVSSAALAALFKQHDISLLASRVEACSNSLLEALHCGLPAIAYNGSSNPELVGKGGLLFEKPEQIPNLLKTIAADYRQYQDGISLPSLSEAGGKYLSFIREISEGPNRIESSGKKHGLAESLNLQLVRGRIQLEAALQRLGGIAARCNSLLDAGK